jgi:hypothetical protein
MVVSGVVFFGPLVVAALLYVTALRGVDVRSRRRVIWLGLGMSVVTGIVVWTLFLTGGISWFMYSPQA